MKPLILAGAALGALLLAAAIANALDRPPTWAQLERERLALEQAQAVAPYQTAAGAALALAPAVAVYLVLGLVAGAGALGLARGWRRLPYTAPDAAGRLPVLLDDAPTARAALAGYHAARITEAQRQPVPHSITYHAPHYRGDTAAVLPGAEAPPAAIAAVPTFAALLDAGKVGRGADGRALPLLLGMDAESGAELPGSWLDLYSTAVAGLPGAGKTTTQRFLACQTALMGARFVVVDPHAEAGDDSLAATLAPLHSAYLCEPASDDRAILAAVRLVADVGERRVKGLDDDTTPLILWADELTKLLGRGTIGAELGELLEAVAQEYRKKRVFVCGSGQIWTAARTGSELRDSFASAIVHRMKRNQARMLLPTEEAAQAERLETGRAILWRTSGATATIAVPLTTGADVRKVGELLGTTPAPAPTPIRSVGFRPAGATVGASEGAMAVPLRPQQDAPKLSAEDAAIVAAFLGGKSPSDLAAELAGGKKSGDGYAKAARHVADVLRRALSIQQFTA